MHISVQNEFFDFSKEVETFSSKLDNIGALVTFTGIVRGEKSKTLDYMLIEHYPGMTEKALTEIAQQARTRWSLEDVLVIHRYGMLKPGEPIMMVSTASAHRKNAFEAADFLMDYLKSRAPFWKKEVTHAGADWVDAKDADEQALNRW